MKNILYRDIPSGMSRPAFYLPVVKQYDRLSVRHYMFPVALFVLVSVIFHRAFMSMWSDLIDFIAQLDSDTMEIVETPWQREERRYYSGNRKHGH